jgi:hypothetical protein
MPAFAITTVVKSYCRRPSTGTDIFAIVTSI